MGKLHIPLEVLNKHVSLSEEEWAVMGNHTIYAARTLFPLIEQDYGTLNRILTALQHHYGVDGGGYPKLRVRRQQSLYARITAIVDTFDAMTTRRIYQRLFLPDEAMAMLQKRAGTRYDPLLVKAFINCMGIYPIGSTVLLTTGELAVVVESNPDPDHVHQPKVKVVTDANKDHREAFLVDLSQPAEAKRAVVRCVDPELFGINSAHYAI
jgi:HD-GYP domain-containing protein (c-di-GMP phosphodiesterase class II)